MPINTDSRVSFAGLEVSIYRSAINDKLVVEIDSSGLAEEDTFDGGVPRIVVYVNEERSEVNSDGGWEVSTAGEDD